MKQHQRLGKKAGESTEQPQAANATYDQFRGRMIAPQAVGKELGLSEFTMHRWIREGKIRAVKLSARCTRIDGDSLADFLMASTFVPGDKEAQPEQLRQHILQKRGKKATASELAGQA
jgi:hypothetical protein